MQIRFPSLLLALTACAVFATQAPPALAGDASFWGTGIGAALGGLVGSTIGKGPGRLAATGAGVFLGGALGNSIGSSIDASSGSYGGYYYAPPSAYTSVYEPNYVAPYAPPPPSVVYVQQPTVIEYRTTSPAIVSGGYVGAESSGAESEAETEEPSPRYCRQFTQKVKIEGKLQETYGTACLQNDGTWKIVH